MADAMSPAEVALMGDHDGMFGGGAAFLLAETLALAAIVVAIMSLKPILLIS